MANVSVVLDVYLNCEHLEKEVKMWRNITWILICLRMGSFADPVSELDASRWQQSGDIYHLKKAGFGLSLIHI